MKILVTGVAGFIGAHLAGALLARGYEVVGIDNMSDYYDVSLKEKRLRNLLRQEPGSEATGFEFHRVDITEREGMEALFSAHDFRSVVHLAAQPGVRHSIDYPHAYVASNVVGFLNVLEGCRHHGIEHLVFASSSSVYGASTNLPFKTANSADHPLSIYAASKKSNELMAHAYAHLFGLPCTGLRFFTAYGPWGRPDMAPMKFAKAMLAGEPIDVYNHGRHARDFTYIDDVVQGVLQVLERPARRDPQWDPAHPNASTSDAPWRLYNIGNHQPVRLMRFIEVLEQALGVEARLNLLPKQPGDVPDTFADVQDLADEFGFSPATSVEDGVERFVAWYREYC